MRHAVPDSATGGGPVAPGRQSCPCGSVKTQLGPSVTAIRRRLVRMSVAIPRMAGPSPEPALLTVLDRVDMLRDTLLTRFISVSSGHLRGERSRQVPPGRKGSGRAMPARLPG